MSMRDRRRVPFTLVSRAPWLRKQRLECNLTAPDPGFGVLYDSLWEGFF
jgi:hypothetical protein